MPEKTQKVVINRKFGGFGLSDAALDRLVEEHDFETTDYDDGEYENPDAEIIDDEGHVTHHYALTDTRSAAMRTHPAVVSVVEELGLAANGRHANLEVVELPADVEWIITEYDGVETIREAHRVWPGGEPAEGVIRSDRGGQ